MVYFFNILHYYTFSIFKTLNKSHCICIHYLCNQSKTGFIYILELKFITFIFHINIVLFILKTITLRLWIFYSTLYVLIYSFHKSLIQFGKSRWPVNSNRLYFRANAIVNKQINPIYANLCDVLNKNEHIYIYFWNIVSVSIIITSLCLQITNNLTTIRQLHWIFL
jgi:hypothetical protein